MEESPGGVPEDIAVSSNLPKTEGGPPAGSKPTKGSIVEAIPLPQTGLDRYLASLVVPASAGDSMVKQEQVEPKGPSEVEVIKQTLPVVIEDLKTYLATTGARKFEGSGPDDEDQAYYAQRNQDLLTLLGKFTEERVLTDREVNYALSFVFRCLDNSMGRSVYSRAVSNKVYAQLQANLARSGSVSTSSPEAEAGKVEEVLNENGLVLANALYQRYGFVPRINFPTDRQMQALDLWAKRVNPDFYTEWEDRKYGIEPSPASSSKPNTVAA